MSQHVHHAPIESNGLLIGNNNIVTKTKHIFERNDFLFHKIKLMCNKLF